MRRNGYALNGLGCGYQSMHGLGAITYRTEPTKDWTCEDWMFWHQELVRAFKAGSFASGIRYNESDAIRLSNQVFNTWWDKLVGFFSSKQYCGYESQFFTYFKNVGLTNILNYFQSIIVPVAKGAGNVSESVSTTAVNVAKTAENTGKTLKWLVPVAVTGAVILVGAYVYKNYIKGNEKVKISPL